MFEASTPGPHIVIVPGGIRYWCLHMGCYKMIQSSQRNDHPKHLQHEPEGSLHVERAKNNVSLKHTCLPGGSRQSVCVQRRSNEEE